VTFLGKWADGIEKTLRPIARVGIYISMAALCLTVLFMVGDVISRSLFKAGFPGTKDVEQFLLCFVTFLGLPWVTLTMHHVKVDLVVGKLPKLGQHLTDTCTSFLGLMIWIFITWQTGGWAIKLTGTGFGGEVLLVPIYPFVYVATIGCALNCIILAAQLCRNIDSTIAESGKKAYWLIACLGAIGLFIWASLGIEVPIDDLLMGALGMLVLLLLLFARMPIAFAMAWVGLVGAWYIMGFEAGLGRLEDTPYYSGTFYYIVIIPFFFLMGSFCFHAAISRDLYDTAYAWLGRLPGGLASATIGGCAGFAAICGDSLATAAAMGTVALPEMQRYKYDDSLSCGAIAAGGTLGILIPPSMGFIFYTIVTEVSTGRLFIAGIIPGICLAILFIIVITIRSILNPKLGPPGPSTTWKQKVISLKGTWAMIVLFFLVIGGIYSGLFTVIEAGAIGALGAFLMLFVKRRFNWQTVRDALIDTAATSSMLLIILVGVNILGYFLGVSKLPLESAEYIASLPVSRYVILGLILLIYVILGCLMNIIPMILLTLPVFWPTIVMLGFDGIWFGVIMVLMMEMGQITPPIGMNVFVIAGVAKSVPLGSIFKGILPFVIVEVIFVVILTIFPQIATWLPTTMMK